MLKRIILAAVIAISATLAHAQSTWPTPQSPSGGPSVTGGVGLCLNASGYAVPCNGSTPTVITPVTQVATYSAGFDTNGYTTPTDLWSICGSSTKTIKLRSVLLSGTATTATSSDFIIVKRSTADTGGSPTTISMVPNDSTNAAATATVVTYGAAPSLGTLVPGELKDFQLTMPPAASSTPALTYLFIPFGDIGQQPPVLRGTAQCVALNFQSAALPAGFHLSISIEWTEE